MTSAVAKGMQEHRDRGRAGGLREERSGDGARGW
jgi:hypothetical protein